MSANPSSTPFDTLRRFARKRPAGECCGLCGQLLPPEHQHLIELGSRRLVCGCDACAILFDGRQSARYRRIPRTIQWLEDFQITDLQWENLHLPISLAFFYFSTPAQRVVAMFPSPAGATESLLALQTWEELSAANPVLGELQPDVEALLVNRVGHLRQYVRAPIDECYKLVGLIRTNWRGLSGGTEVWGRIAGFFDDLKRRSSPAGDSHA